jgi:hypothetical protein
MSETARGSGYKVKGQLSQWCFKETPASAAASLNFVPVKKMNPIQPPALLCGCSAPLFLTVGKMLIR